MDLEWKQRVVLFLVAALGTGLLMGCGSQQLTAASASSNAARPPSSSARAVTVRAAPAISESISVTTTYSAVAEAEDLVNVVPLGSKG